MAVMPKEVQDAFNQMKNIVLATATPDGVPNADPMGMKKVIDAETVYISDQFFNKTLANLKENQKVAITFWGDEGAYQIHGTATYINEGEQFEELKAWVDGCFAAQMREVESYGRTVEIEGCYSNRNGKDKPCDKSFTSISFRDGDEVVAGVGSFTCHSTVLGPDNLLVSSDLAGYVARALEKEWGVYPVIMIGAA